MHMPQLPQEPGRRQAWIQPQSHHRPAPTLKRWISGSLCGRREEAASTDGRLYMLLLGLGSVGLSDGDIEPADAVRLPAGLRF